jgi:ATP-dependent protease ClpP protease subunit
MTIKNRAGAKTPEGYRMINRGAGRGEVFLYGPIGMDFWGDGISAKVFADDLKKLGNVTMIDVRINSEGGDVFDGKAMYTLAERPPRQDHRAHRRAGGFGGVLHCHGRRRDRDRRGRLRHDP